MLMELQPRHDDRRLRRDVWFNARVATAGLRMVPSFLIVGAMKCGTSTLYHTLKRHPLVLPPLRKETHYFTLGRRMGKNEAWYRAHFPLRHTARRGTVTFEATPGYMFDESVAPAIAAMLPDVRLIVLVRDPVERAISHYFHEVRMGRERLPIEEAMALEDDRLAAARSADGSLSETYYHASYKKRGRYAEQIARLYAHIPEERVLVLGSHTLFERPTEAVATVTRFLGLPDLAIDEPPRRRNAGANRVEVSDELRAGLRPHFEPEREALHTLTGWWPDW